MHVHNGHLGAFEWGDLLKTTIGTAGDVFKARSDAEVAQANAEVARMYALQQQQAQTMGGSIDPRILLMAGAALLLVLVLKR